MSMERNMALEIQAEQKKKSLLISILGDKQSRLSETDWNISMFDLLCGCALLD